MRMASAKYKEIMNREIRNRAYISVGIGIVNQNAQKDGIVSSECLDWGNKNAIFDNNSDGTIYATMEENFFKADGSMFFMPEEYYHTLANRAVTENILGQIRIDFSEVFSIKGLMIDFGEYYPTEFTIQTSEKTLTYTNTTPNFQTTDVLGDTAYILIIPLSMIGGQQRLRINNIVMGTGLTFSNSDVQNISVSDYVSTVSEELPSQILTLNLFDKENRFNVDDSNSFIQFLETMQKVTVSFGLELDDESIEWIDYATLFLSDWDNKKGILTVKASDRISRLEDEYTLGYKIYERTAYDEAVSILTDAGLEPDEYRLDEYLKDVVLQNPMPIGTHKVCLQLIANICRCILYQDSDGRIAIKANFANVIEPEDLTVSTNGTAEWSKPQNILIGTEYVYADLLKNFFKMDGTMYFMSEDSSYLETAYVSEQISNENGLFETNPIITIQLPAAYTYYGINVKFDGNPPKEVIVHTYLNEELVQNAIFDDLRQESFLYYEFDTFDKIVLEFVKTEPYNRILVNQIAFGDLTDYVLIKKNMMESPHGYVEEKVKSVSVRIFSFENDENGEPQEVSNSVYVRKTIGFAGKNKICENPLVSTQEQAEKLAEWLGNYYANNISYDVSYRGEPRIAAADIIKMESDVINNLQVEVTSQTLKFNGAFSGTLEMRKALRMV